MHGFSRSPKQVLTASHAVALPYVCLLDASGKEKASRIRADQAEPPRRAPSMLHRLTMACLAARGARAFVGLRRAPRTLLRMSSSPSSNSFELEGTIAKIGDVQKFDSGFEKIEFVVKTEQDMYPQEIKFELLRDKIELLDAYSVDQRVLVSFNIRGNAWQDKHFVNLVAWRLQALASGTAAPAAAPSAFGGAFASYEADAPAAEKLGDSLEKKGDLPF